MKSDEIQKQISALEPQLEEKRAELDALVEEFRAELPHFAQPWMQKYLDQAIENHSKEIELFSIEKVRALKDEARALFSRLPEIALEETKHQGAWPHNRAPEEPRYGQEKDEHFFNKTFRSVISYIAPVLDRFELLTVPKGHISDWKRVGENRFSYAYNPMFPEIPSATHHREVFAVWTRIKGEIDEKREELSKAKAKELWDAA